MNANKILRYGLEIPCFLGVFQLPDLAKLNVVKNNVGFIVIHDDHAIAVFVTETSIDLLDPLGPQNNKTFIPICKFLSSHLPCKLLRINTKLQADSSSKCAEFCLLFLYLRCNNYSFHATVNLFTCEYDKNDQTVTNLFNMYFREE